MSIFFRGVKWLVVGGILLAVFLAWCFFIEFPVLEGSLSGPDVVTLDETFSLVVTATNSTEKKITLDSVDIAEDFLEGFEVISVEPKPKDTLKIFGLHSWEFGLRVEPEESVAIEFTLKAIELGHFSGDLDICNPNQDFYTLFPDIVVREAAESLPSE